MTEDEKAAAAHLTETQKDEVSSYYVWATVARRLRLRRDRTWRRARCCQCGGPRQALRKAECAPARCLECWSKAQANIYREKKDNLHRLTERPAVLILG